MADGTWTGIVDLTWQLGDLEAEHSRADVAVSFSPDGDALEIAGFGAADRGRGPLWLRGGLWVGPSDGVLVLVEGTQNEADAVAQRVTRGDGCRPPRPVVAFPGVAQIPASAADIDDPGVAAGTYAAIAVVATTAGSST